jgi:hypothetical protein
MSWRDVLPIHPAAELFPRMSPDELKGLGEDIHKKNGLLMPVTVWKAQKHFPPQLLDGRNRLDAMEAFGFTIDVENVGTDSDPAIRLWMEGPEDEDWRAPIEVIEVPRDHGIDPYVYVIGANIHRRHLTGEQRRELIAKLLKTTPEKSDRQIAETVKASPTTVGSVRAEIASTVQSGQLPEKRVGKDGKARKQPSRKTHKAGKPKAQIREQADALVDDIIFGDIGRTRDRARDDIGADSTAEAERLRVYVEKLEADKRRLEIKILGLESEIEEAKAAAKSPPENKPGSRCSICHEKKCAPLRPVFICDGCVDIYEVREAAPPASDGLDIPEPLRRAAP